MAEHLEHRTVPDALAADCFYGECEHLNEDGEPSDYSACPRISLDVCVECMVEEGYGDDPRNWEELMIWPHGAEMSSPSAPARPKPTILRPPPEHVSCRHGYSHHGGSHSCDSCVGGSCAYWSWVEDHERAVAKHSPEEITL